MSAQQELLYISILISVQRKKKLLQPPAQRNDTEASVRSNKILDSDSDPGVNYDWGSDAGLNADTDSRSIYDDKDLDEKDYAKDPKKRERLDDYSNNHLNQKKCYKCEWVELAVGCLLA